MSGPRLPRVGPLARLPDAPRGPDAGAQAARASRDLLRHGWVPVSGSSVSALSMRPSWLSACGKLPRKVSVGGSISSE